MHFTFRKRYLVLLTPLAALAAIVFLGGGGGKAIRTFATGPTPAPTPNLTGVSCADVYVDLGNDGNPDDLQTPPNGIGEDDITSLTMTRLEPSQTQSGKWDASQVSYLGYAAPPALVPGGPPGPSCASTTAAARVAVTGAEHNQFGGQFQVAYTNHYGVRPTSIDTYTECLSGLPAPDCAGPDGIPGNVDDSPNHSGILKGSTCGYTEVQQAWVRIDSTTHILKTGPSSANSGAGVLYLGTAAPTSGGIDINGDGVNDATTDPTSCDTTGSFAYHFVYTSSSRDATTDFPSEAKNSALSIPSDTDGPSGGKDNQVADTADSKADDWDGDGCPDWDELGKAYMPGSLPLTYPPVYTWSATNPVSGMDPFNPADCNNNLTSTISMTVTVTSPVNGHNTGGATSGNAIGCNFGLIATHTCPYGNGYSFYCLGSASQTKTGPAAHQDLSYRLGCYADTAAPVGTVINASNPDDPYDASRHEGGGAGPATCGDTIDNDLNGKIDAADASCHDSTCPPAPANLCGDGRADKPPPGCVDNPSDGAWCANATAGTCPSLPCPVKRFSWTGIDPTSYPVVAADPASNYYDTVANVIHLGGCFAGFGGGNFGNVFGSSTIDAHTGAGSFSIYLNQNPGGTDCGGAPTGTPFLGQITLVELRTEKGLTDDKKYDSDRDGCSDARELGSTQSAGGVRDPYNPWDYFNPEKTQTPSTQTVADILKTVSQFGKNQGNVAYTNTTDRTGVPGGQSWNLGAPDGQQTVADILAAVKQFGQNCPRVIP